MTNNKSDNLNLKELLHGVQQQLSLLPSDEHSLREVGTSLSQFSDAANISSEIQLFRGASLLVSVLELAACWTSQYPEDPQLVRDLVNFVNENVHVLHNSMVANSDEKAEIDQFIRAAFEKWNDYLILLDDDAIKNDFWEMSSVPGNDLNNADLENGQNDDQDVVDSNAQIELLLGAVSDSAPNLQDASAEADLRTENDQPATTILNPDASQIRNDNLAKVDLAKDRELLEAYLDDAVRCLSVMEQAALAIESSPEDKEPVQQFCRELHTLKGASATVGLSELAGYLHDLESSLDDVFQHESERVEVDILFNAVDRIRDEIESLQPDSRKDSANRVQQDQTLGPETFSAQPAVSNFASTDDASIRIRAAKLDRLMDMLAELVVLRNRRESHVAEFNLLNDELARCASRLKFAQEQSEFEYNGDEHDPQFGILSRNGSSTFSEVGKDISAVSLGLRELQKPVSQDNSAISRFIRDFRQELMQLRRIPVSGLFNRLQRSARDAAKSENKQVLIKVVGENAGLEQEIQERLFESLLHIVRNSVSHGIESRDRRTQKGKDPVGTVTLEAYSSAQLLVIEVRDDGNGLDYNAVQKRAIEKGLLSPNHPTTKEELANLIFHPGFSTREAASEVSGRGVGMDIVAKTIDQLHGRIEVDSIAGKGTTIRLLIPLRTGIEHVMVFRSDGQLFALPMQSVTAAKSSNANIGNVGKFSLSTAFSLRPKNDSATEDVLLLRKSTDSRKRISNGMSESEMQFALAVDELVGPEEVVVRGLPNLLKGHPLFCGVTLSGSGETVLLLDSEKVMEFCHEYQFETGEDESEASWTESDIKSHKKTALVVDDSLTARRVLVKFLQEHEFVTVEAGDGIEAIERLHRDQFDLVFTDLDMPRLGGLELLADIQSGRYCDAPVVVVSSRDEEKFRTKAMDSGANDYLTKPVSEKSIMQLLESLQLLPETSRG